MAQPASQVLKRFDGNDGATPQSALLIGVGGAVYGTTTAGGRFGSGLVFELMPPVAGTTAWTLTHLYDFCVKTGCEGGTFPMAGVTRDGDGGFLGTTSAGGGNDSGTVFRLQPSASGSGPWSLSELYHFCREAECRDGGAPEAPVLRGTGNVLYGTTFMGGAHGYGVVFMLSPPSAGGTEWRYAVIHDFAFHDGAEPVAGLTLGPAGELYGTTSQAGAHGHGTAFELVPPTTGSGAWSFRVLYDFCAERNCRDGANPYSALLRGRDGALYGTTQMGGSFGGWGAVYALYPPDYRRERVLHEFDFADGAAPIGGLIAGNSGALYGTTSLDGPYGYGTVFRLSPASGGRWGETVLHAFSGPDGDGPAASLTAGKDKLYGTTEYGGSAANYGAVFSVAP